MNVCAHVCVGVRAWVRVGAWIRHVTFVCLSDSPGRFLPATDELVVVSKQALETSRIALAEFLAFDTEAESGGGAAPEPGPPPPSKLSKQQSMPVNAPKTGPLGPETKKRSRIKAHVLFSEHWIWTQHMESKLKICASPY